MPALLDPKNLPKSEEEIDFSDLEAKYSLELEESFDNIIVVDGLPKVDEAKFDKLLSVVQKIFKKYGTIKPEGLSMPQHKDKDGKLMTSGFLFMEFETPEQAALAVKNVNGYAFDKKHTIAVNKFSEIEHYTNLSDEYVEPTLEPYVEKEHLLGHLADPLARDQLVTLIGDFTSIVWNNKGEAPEPISSKRLWTESYAVWSPRGTYLTTFHRQGVALWGGSSWHKLIRFVHPGVKLIDFSPSERYLVSWSNDPITAGVAPFTEEHEGHNICIWDVKTGVLLRTFPNLSAGEDEAPVKMTWPAFKWSPNEKYFARCVPGQMLSIYEAPGMGLLEKKSLKVDGIADFDWAPAFKNSGEKKDPKSKKPEDLLVYWTPEQTNTPARVTLISVPSKEILRTKNLFNVTDCKFYWHSTGNLLAVRVNRVTKSKKSTYSNLEIFRAREKDIPVEVLELKDTILSFAWEPAGNERFSIISTTESAPPVPTAMGVAPPTVRTNVSVYAREVVAGTKKTLARDNFKQVAFLEKQTVNTLVWSPKGRHFVMATLRSQSTFDVEFCDMDFNKDVKNKKDNGIGFQILATAEHYGLTDIEWDPTGRYVVTSSSVWRHANENGFCIWDFKGTLQHKKIIDNFKQVLWRPRPKSLLNQEQRKQIRKNLDSYSVQFDEEDIMSRNAVSAAVLTQRKRLVDEWKAWRVRMDKQIAEERSKHAPCSKSLITDDSNEEIEEWVEEVVEEFEEIVD
ncbi:Translation initiation factor 3 subunit b [Entomophthora muscae]|uniref:Translation initiation factor 3 subunit b n=1 Tax=Entomophthora muscae TaxID=34485 RepID=A0ACC2SKY5_9FUNG|nr:Translation initiation factor 3 subunit b [Entomophthora muscae]